MPAKIILIKPQLKGVVFSKSSIIKSTVIKIWGTEEQLCDFIMRESAENVTTIEELGSK